ncbi:O-antigen ligase family protein [Acinetobacter larvae]|uniref:Ligase n=1 Tax=Acinetobacter larvae TaxID=1789224 RepID=A0A1B2LVW1_9GAMM|nr:O-antigen ligase family protein [Acinetobacter larvae]AOA57080.1 hypothetical protein BFG52_01085 [Acinetobacter larvae]
MKALLLVLSAILFAWAWMVPVHRTPWTTFHSEILSFSAVLSICLIFVLRPLTIRKPQLIGAIFLLLPMGQWLFGQQLYLSNALLCTAYIVMFWLMIAMGDQLSQTTAARENLFKWGCLLLFVVALASCFIAMVQWLHLSPLYGPYMSALKGNRPYANFAQPNNFATFLTMGLLATLYCFEKRHLPAVWVSLFAALFIFSIALTQSRTSWVVALFLLLYCWGFRKRASLRIKPWQLLLGLTWFVLCVVYLPVITTTITTWTGQPITHTVSAVERASSGYLRLDMWKQSLIAIFQQPWFGYGWNQTGMAQIAAFDHYPSNEWYKSAHNIVLDLVIWNGIPIAIVLLSYLSLWMVWLQKGVRDVVSVFASLMVAAILIHALLEYPIHYAYFLLPMGFLLGVIQAQYPKLPAWTLPRPVMALWIVIVVVCMTVFSLDYTRYKTLNIAASNGQLSSKDQHSIVLLDQFKQRLWWLNTDPYQKRSIEEIQYIQRMVAQSASYYDLLKYAKVLFANGQVQEARHQIWIINTLHNKNISLQDLEQKTTS